MEHLSFTKVELPANERRKRRGFGSTIKKDYSKQGETLIFQLNQQTKESLLISKKLKFSPYLVVKVELEKDSLLSDDNISKLESMDLRVIDMENKELMVLFADDYQLQEFRNALVNYKNGVIAKTKIENEDLFAMIKSVTRWGKEDRKGQDIDKLFIEDYIDCYLWIFDSLNETKIKVEEFVSDAKGHNAKYCDKYVSQSVAIVRLKIERKDLNYYLEHPLIYRIDRMPNYQMKRVERAQLSGIGLRDIKYTNNELDEESPSICIIDSGILSGHPLLKDCMGDAKTFYITNDYVSDENDIDGHGTMVAGICEYGIIDIQDIFAPSIRLFNAKIHDGYYIGNFQFCLDELKVEGFGLDFEQEDLIYRFFVRKIDMETLITGLNIKKRLFEFRSIINKYINIYEKLRPSQMREIVEYFYNNYNCRIYNLSQGDFYYPYDDGKSRAWTCVLDELQREYDVVFIVSTGNYDYIIEHDKVEDILREYPQYFYRSINTRIIDPAASVNSITVGGLANSSTAYVSRDEQLSLLPISKKDEIASITRVGPGINKSVKPDFVAYSGDEALNVVLKRFSSNIGFQVLSLSNDLTNSLFTYDKGTSFAAPFISHIAALILKKYGNCSNNLIRAILASSSSISMDVVNQLDEMIIHSEYLRDTGDIYKQNAGGTIGFNKQKLLHYTIGYGFPVKSFAIESYENRVVLFADMKDENSIQVDKTHIFEVPIPSIFTGAKGRKRIIISLAFNPEVRKTRLDYMGTSMSFELIRGQGLSEVYTVCASQAGKEEKKERFKDRFICKMENAGKTLREYGTLQRGVFEFTTSNYGDNYYVVVDCKRNWSTENQNYALVVTYETDDEIKLYNEIKQRIRVRRRERV